MGHEPSHELVHGLLAFSCGMAVKNELWLSSPDRPAIAAAANEIDQLLRYRPSSKGRAVHTGGLRTELIDQLFERSGEIPEEVRLLQYGPIEAVFTAHEMDAQVRVWYVAGRGECLRGPQ